MKHEVNTPGPDNMAMSSYWAMVTTIITGAGAMRKAGELYLPKFPSETDKNYEFRRDTGKFTNIYRDIIEGLSSKPFSQPLKVEKASPRLEEIIDDVDGKGNNLHVFASNTFFNGINSAIDWIFVDFPQTDGLTSVAEEKVAGVRPHWIHIAARNVLEIKSKKIEGVEQIFFVSILEPNKDGDKVRIFKREGSAVVWELWQQSKERVDGGKWVIIEEGSITIGVIPLVPFITGRRKGSTWKFFPPMQDAADLQIELYQQESSLKYSKTLACFPMLVGNGIDPIMDGTGKVPLPVPVGPHAVLYAPPGPDGNHGEWVFIEPSSECLRFLAADIKETKLDLRELGRQPLTAQSGGLTVITTAFAAVKANSAVQMWAFALKDVLEKALHFTSLWLGESDNAEVDIFTDFDTGADNDNAPEVLLKLRGTNDLSQETLLSEMKRRGILSAEFDFGEEVARLIEELPGEDEFIDKTAAAGQQGESE